MSSQRLLHSPLPSPFTRPLTRPLGTLADRARAWSVQSQLVARRNAVVASADLAARRRDREDVDAYFAGRRPGAVDHTRARRRSP